jgi:hypothetical protein
MQCYECARECEDMAARVAILARPERFCCLECGRQFVERLKLPILLGIGTLIIVTPEESPLKIAILGVKRQPGAPEPVRITTPEEWREYYGDYPPPPSELTDTQSPHVFVPEATPEQPAPLYVGDGLPRIAGTLT